MKQKVIIFGVIMLLCSLSPSVISAQEDAKSRLGQLEARTKSLEASIKQLKLDIETMPIKVNLDAEGVEKRISHMERNVDSLETYIREFTSNLTNFTKEIGNQIDVKVRVGGDKVIALDPGSNKFTKIDTNGGVFLLAINKFQATEEGYRMLLNVGNLNNATYTGLKFKLHWGKAWDPNSTVKYNQWRSTLVGGEYNYPGELFSGEWTEITFDLTPAGSHVLEYIECEMEVEGVQLLKQPTE